MTDKETLEEKLDRIIGLLGFVVAILLVIMFTCFSAITSGYLLVQYSRDPAAIHQNR